MNIYLFQQVVGIGVLALQIIIALLVIYLIYRKVTNKKVPFLEKIFSKNGMLIVGFSILLSFISSMIFSDVYEIEACKLCWLQRVTMYPQMLIMFIAIKRKDTHAWAYSLWLSIIGLLLALYQTIEQFRLVALPEAECVIGPDAACSQIHMLEFGYITLPVASITIFVFIIVLYFMRRK